METVKTERDKLPLMEQIEDIEDATLKSVTSTINHCVSRTGRIPRLRIRVDSDDCDEDGSVLTIPEFTPKSGRQRDAIMKLIDYCLDAGDWSSRSSCKRWIRDQISSSKC